MKRESASVRLPEQRADGEVLRSALAGQKHYTPGDLAELWGLSPQTIRELFAEEPGVIRVGEPSRREGRTLKRGYFTIRIPESVAIRVHTRLTSTKMRRRA
jgi:hypothetical protein